jgi:hypothetical protein
VELESCWPQHFLLLVYWLTFESPLIPVSQVLLAISQVLVGKPCIVQHSCFLILAPAVSPSRSSHPNMASSTYIVSLGLHEVHMPGSFPVLSQLFKEQDLQTSQVAQPGEVRLTQRILLAWPGRLEFLPCAGWSHGFLGLGGKPQDQDPQGQGLSPGKCDVNWYKQI